MIKRKRGRPRKLIKKGTTREASQVIQARAVASYLVENPAVRVSDAIRAVGLSEHKAQHPTLITSTPAFQDLLNEYLPEGDLLETHRGLLKAARIDHMIFADGPKDDTAAIEWVANKNAKEGSIQVWTRDDVLTDDDIRDIMSEKNCEVRRISRTEQSRHVYFWSPDSKSRTGALDMAYKLKGSYAADKASVAFSLASLARLRDTPPDSPAAIVAPPNQAVIGASDDE